MMIRLWLVVAAFAVLLLTSAGSYQLGKRDSDRWHAEHPVYKADEPICEGTCAGENSTRLTYAGKCTVNGVVNDCWLMNNSYMMGHRR